MATQSKQCNQLKEESILINKVEPTSSSGRLIFLNLNTKPTLDKFDYLLTSNELLNIQVTTYIKVSDSIILSLQIQENKSEFFADIFCIGRKIAVTLNKI